jgi:hypothetical protein
MSQISVIGGKMQFSKLTLNLLKKNEREYLTGKAICWLNMMNDGMNPVRWNKPNKNGTGVKFEAINNQYEYDKALIDLQAFDKKHGLDLDIRKADK